MKQHKRHKCVFWVANCSIQTCTSRLSSLHLFLSPWHSTKNSPQWYWNIQHWVTYGLSKVMAHRGWTKDISHDGLNGQPQVMYVITPPPPVSLTGSFTRLQFDTYSPSVWSVCVTRTDSEVQSLILGVSLETELIRKFVFWGNHENMQFYNTSNHGYQTSLLSRSLSKRLEKCR